MLTTVLCVTRPHNSAHALHLYGSFVTDPARGCLLKLLCVRYLSSLTPSECATRRAPERRDGVMSKRTCACTGEDRWPLYIAATAHVRTYMYLQICWVIAVGEQINHVKKFR